MARKKKRKSGEPTFTRGDVAEILQVHKLTIANREKSGRYPEPKRDVNNYRIYSLNDVLNLQMITNGALDTRPIMAILYDKGWKDPKEIGPIIDTAMRRKRAE